MEDKIDDSNDYIPRRASGRIGAGFFLLLIGGLLLAQQLGAPLPAWIFSWHCLLIAIGIFVGLKHNFRGGAWIVLILVGGFFLIQDHFPDIPMRRFLWPAALMFLGIMVMVAPRGGRWRRRCEADWRRKGEDWRRKGEDWQRRGEQWKRRHQQHFSSSGESYSSEDFINSTAIFGGVHKKIVSKTFKGGDVTSIMGGTELDLSQADFEGTVRLDVTQIMGGTKIIVPPHWEVRSEVTAVFAGFEDKRQQPTVHNPNKVLILEGTSFFGGIELKNY